MLVGAAGDPPVGERRFDAVLVRHVVWTLPAPAAALARWVDLLRPGGRLVRRHRVERLDDPALWGRPIADERYAPITEVGGARPAPPPPAAGRRTRSA